ncbi:MAG: hypothetical protein U5N86_03290 [Planctomycetota bacterium]|nr:hypothetical protein [Planctomycetota bacterium]
MFTGSTPNGFVSSAHWAGPFENPPDIASVGEAVVTHPATTATVWNGLLSNNDTLELSDDGVDVVGGKYYIFEILLAVHAHRAGRYKLVLQPLGACDIFVDGVRITSISAADYSSTGSVFSFGQFPGDFREVPRKIDLVIKARYGMCGLALSLESPETTNRAECLSLTKWPAKVAPSPEQAAAKAVSVKLSESGVVYSDSPPSLELKLSGGLPVGREFNEFSFESTLATGDESVSKKFSFNRPDLEYGVFAQLPVPETDRNTVEVETAITVKGELCTRHTSKLYLYDNILAKADVVRRMHEKFTAENEASPELQLRHDQLLVISESIRQAGIFYDVPGGVKKMHQLYTDYLALRESLLEGRDFYASKTGELERAYISDIDGSPQPYKLYLPPDYHTKPEKAPVHHHVARLRSLLHDCTVGRGDNRVRQQPL